MITTDFYFPEIGEVLRLKGAEILVWQDFPERLREHFQWLPLLYARADRFPRLPGHRPLRRPPDLHHRRTTITGCRGAAFGRSMVIDRSGTIRSDTGYRHGIATLELRPRRAEEGRVPDDPEFRKPLLRSQ